MDTHGNLEKRLVTRATVQSLGLAIVFAAAAACENADDTGGVDGAAGNATASAGTTASGGSPSVGGAPAQAGQANGGQNSTAGQSSIGGSAGSSGQTSTGGQNSTGGSAGSAGQTSTGGSAGSGGRNATGGSGGSGGCQHVQLKGSDICTIGDSWIQLPGNQVTTLENHMVAANVIPQGAHFDRREVSGTPLSDIIETYDDRPSNCKILIMDGGGIDLFNTPAGDQAAIAPVVKKFEDFLVKVKNDGFVQHIIYSLYPVIPGTRNLNSNMKPGFSAACAASAVDCHLVDLEPLFQGQHFAGDNIHADNAGGVIIGNAWWKVMQENCIAQ